MRHHCAIGNHPIHHAPARVIGLDQSRWPAVPPTSLYACPACIQAAGYTGATLVHPGQQPADLLPHVPQPGSQAPLTW